MSGDTDIDLNIDITSTSSVELTWTPIQDVNEYIVDYYKHTNLVGDYIYGEIAYEKFGNRVRLSNDGTILAVGAKNWDNDRGRVKIFEYNDINNNWDQIGSIEGTENSTDLTGNSISLSDDGQYIAIGELGYGSNKGRVRIFNYNSDNNWELIGNPLGENSTQPQEMGQSISLKKYGDDIFIAVSSISYKSDIDSDFKNGLVEIYRYTINVDSDWQLITQFENTVGSNETNAPKFGWNVELSNNGQVIAISMISYNYGKVYIYQNNNGNWELKGTRIEILTFAQDSTIHSTDNEAWFGYSISLSNDGSKIAISAILFGLNQNGRVFIYEYDGSDWEIIGNPIGDSTYYKFGNSISLSNNGEIVAIGSPRQSN